MCNLYANTLAPTLMRQLFNVRADNDQLGNAEPLTAIFPKGTAPIVALDEDGNRVLRNTHWGFVLPQTSKKTGKPAHRSQRAIFRGSATSSAANCIAPGTCRSA